MQKSPPFRAHRRNSCCLAKFGEFCVFVAENSNPAFQILSFMALIPHILPFEIYCSSGATRVSDNNNVPLKVGRVAPETLRRVKAKPQHLIQDTKGYRGCFFSDPLLWCTVWHLQGPCRPCLSQHFRRRMMRISIKDSIGTTRVLSHMCSNAIQHLQMELMATWIDKLHLLKIPRIENLHSFMRNQCWWNLQQNSINGWSILLKLAA